VQLIRAKTIKTNVDSFHLFGSNFDLMLKIPNLFIQICCLYIMETCGMISNEYNADILLLKNSLNIITNVLKHCQDLFFGEIFLT
jgi:hypothetical protein